MKATEIHIERQRLATRTNGSEEPQRPEATGKSYIDVDSAMSYSDWRQL